MCAAEEGGTQSPALINNGLIKGRKPGVEHSSLCSKAWG